MTTGAEVEHRVEDHAPHDVARSGQDQVDEVRARTDDQAEEAAAQERAGQTPHRRPAGQAERQAEIDAVQKGKAGEQPAGDSPSTGVARSVLAGRMASLQHHHERGQAEGHPADPGDRRELQCREHEQHGEQTAGERHPAAPPAHEGVHAERHAGQLGEADQALDHDADAEHLVDPGEHPETARAVEVQEGAMGNVAAQDAIGEGEHEALLHGRSR